MKISDETAVDAPKTSIIVLTGEPSGDLHAATLIRAMRKINPGLYISGIGGPCMEAEQVDIFFSIDKLSAMGITEVISQFKYIKLAFDSFKSRLRTHLPDLIILIDYPGFNLKAAQYAKQKFDIPIFYYITPKVWAWKESRLKQIKKYIDHAALILPFEEKLYNRAGIPSTYVGNPLVDDYPDHMAKPFRKLPFLAEKCSIKGSGNAKDLESMDLGPVIGLLPGSRKAEITNLLGIMLEAALIIHQQKKRARFLISAASGLHSDRIQQILSPYNQTGLFEVIQGRSIDHGDENRLPYPVDHHSHRE